MTDRKELSVGDTVWLHVELTEKVAEHSWRVFVHKHSRVAAGEHLLVHEESLIVKTGKNRWVEARDV